MRGEGWGEGGGDCMSGVRWGWGVHFGGGKGLLRGAQKELKRTDDLSEQMVG